MVMPMRANILSHVVYENQYQEHNTKLKVKENEVNTREVKCNQK